MRVHELAKELQMTSKWLAQELTDLGVDVKNHMSTLSDEDADRVRKKIRAEFGGGEGEDVEETAETPDTTSTEPVAGSEDAAAGADPVAGTDEAAANTDGAVAADVSAESATETTPEESPDAAGRSECRRR